ncbi:hypothetical protein [Streptomyces sp. McG3]|uniref:hypothetical protein n=1 Tax=Streptomyces sp. McG3 TaxID=2725483 RepID=UPI001BE67053|nr:hypothetical protein [Streptomyces sp. McG3]MBT2895671.1 hypothetical protein [Streptomyces sp. McG3]
MTLLTRRRLSGVSLRVHRGDSAQSTAITLRREGQSCIAAYDPERISLDAATMLIRMLSSSEGEIISEVVLDDHDPALAALYHAASKLLLDVEITDGPRITCPTVRARGQDPARATYFIPQGWDLTDALDELPAAFTDARPEAARNLKLIERAKKDSEGKIDHALDIVAMLILETDDPDSVYDEMLSLFDEGRSEETTVDAPATAA